VLKKAVAFFKPDLKAFIRGRGLTPIKNILAEPFRISHIFAKVDLLKYLYRQKKY